MAADESNAATNGKVSATEEGRASESEAGPDILKNLNYSLLLFGFSLLSLLNVAIFMLATDPIVQGVVLIIDVPLSVIFIVDFWIRLRLAPSKINYLIRDFGWADFITCLPYPPAKFFRLFRVWRAWRFVSHYGARNLRREFRDHRADSALSVLAFLIVCVSEFGGILVTVAERSDPQANIKTASDAMWWAVVTVATVGYGDRYPVTDWGRLIGLFIMMTGVALLGVLTGYLANAFLAPPKRTDEEKQQPARTPVQPEAQAMLDEMKRLLTEQEKAQDELRAMLAELREVRR